MPTLTLPYAAQLAAASYAKRLLGAIPLHDPGGRTVAHLMPNGVLAICGTNGPDDWFDFNLPTARMTGAEAGFAAASPVAALAWSRGFLLAAAELAAALPSVPRYIVGHSLGGAITQILALHYGVPAVTFAAPQPSRMPRLPTLQGEAEVLNVVYLGDLVPRFPGGHTGTRRIGSDHLVALVQGHTQPHKMAGYCRLVDLELAAGRIAASWPPSVGASSSRRPVTTKGPRSSRRPVRV